MQGFDLKLCQNQATRYRTFAIQVQGKCTICMEEFAAGDSLRCLPCLHSYHVPCIDKWLSLSQACPVCKHNVMATTSPCFDSPTGQMRCPMPPLPTAWQFNRFARPSFQVMPRLPLLRAPLPHSSARVSAQQSLPQGRSYPSSAGPTVPVYRSAVPAPSVPGVPSVLVRAPTFVAPQMPSPALPTVAPVVEESESDSSSSRSSTSSSGNSSP